MAEHQQALESRRRVRFEREIEQVEEELDPYVALTEAELDQAFIGQIDTPRGMTDRHEEGGRQRPGATAPTAPPLEGEFRYPATPLGEALPAYGGAHGGNRPPATVAHPPNIEYDPNVGHYFQAHDPMGARPKVVRNAEREEDQDETLQGRQDQDLAFDAINNLIRLKSRLRLRRTIPVPLAT